MSKNSPTHNTNVSRRDALKLLTAAVGAAALANVPTHWSKPNMEVGVLPAHAQTSIVHVLSTLPEELLDSQDVCHIGQEVVLKAEISPQTENVSLQYELSYAVTGESGSITSPSPLTDTLTTDINGQVSLTVVVTPDSSAVGTVGILTVVWSFVNPSDGTNTVSQDVDIEIGC